jgi:hypothetical protein
MDQLAAPRHPAAGTVARPNDIRPNDILALRSMLRDTWRRRSANSGFQGQRVGPMQHFSGRPARAYHQLATDVSAAAVQLTANAQSIAA